MVSFLATEGGRGASLQKTCRHEVDCANSLLLFMNGLLLGERARGVELASRLITIEKYSGLSRYKTAEGRRRKMDQIQVKRTEKQKGRTAAKQNIVISHMECTKDVV